MIGFYRQKSANYLLNDTLVSNIFINDVMPAAPANYVKVYLYAYMYSDIADIIVTNDDIARELDLEIEEVLAAWPYFEKKGVIKKRHKSKKNMLEYDVEFIDIKSSLHGFDMSEGEEENESERAPSENESKKMFSEIEKVNGAPLSPNSAEKIAGMIEREKIDPEMITLAYRELKKPKSKVYVSSVERLLAEWRERNLSTVDDVKEHLANIDQRADEHRIIGSYLGLYPPFTENEKETFDAWLEDFTLADIKELASKAAGKNNKYSYVAKIIQSEKNKTREGGTVKKKKNKRPDRKLYYERVRAVNKERLEKRRAEVEQKIPTLADAEEGIITLSRDLTKILISKAANKDAKAKAERAKIKELERKKEDMLEAAGFARGYLDEIVSCEKCHDTGIKDDGTSCDCFMEAGK
jgi:DnaD/phage-associated family protein